MREYSDVEKMLETIVDDTPWQLYEGLSGGVILSDQTKLHPGSIPSKPLYILGEYQTDSMGRRIVIYCGSFRLVYGHLPDGEFFEKLRHTFAHELRHHMESRSGVRDLDRFDDERYRRYKMGVDIAEFHEPPIG